MPFRYLTSLAAYHLRRNGTTLPPLRQFHGSRALQDDVAPDSRSHYHVLNVRPDASPAEIKKSFYALSKAHHPDHNPSDAKAPGRFMRISAAYAVLSAPDRRAAYDRAVLQTSHPHHHHHHHRHAPHHKGSYSSTGPAGGRPASGLSRRRGTFTGPPPSFFRSGGWGAHGAKRAAAHDESTGGSGSDSRGTHHVGAGAGAGAAAGMGPGQGYAHQRHHDDAPHFDRVAHERTQQRIDRRRAAAAAADGLGHDVRGRLAEPGVLASFFLVSGALILALLTPAFIYAKSGKKESRAEGGGGSAKR